MKDQVTTPTTVYSSPTLYSDSFHKERILYDLDIQPNEDDDFQPDESYYSKLRKPSIYMLYSTSDIPIVLLALISTIAGALAPAISSILMGRVFDVLSDFSSGKYSSFNEYMHEITIRSMSLIALGAGSIFVVWSTITCWMSIGEYHGIRARKHMMKSFLEKPISWYESNTQVMGDLTQINRCVEELRAGNSEATALVLQSIASIIALLGTSFYYSWSVTLIMLASTPLIVIFAFVFARMIEKFTKNENTETSTAAKIFDWCLTSSKLVRLFSTKDIENEKFSNAVQKCKRQFINLSLATALNLGTMRFLILCMFVQGFWFGSSQVKQGKATTGDVLTCFTSCLMVGECFRSTLPQVVVIQKANVAIERIQEFIQLREKNTMKTKFNKKIELKDSRNISMYPKACNGDIRFKGIEFAYPTRPDSKVLKNVDIHFPSGELTFLVGRSGSGKSTLSSLLLNFYKPLKGRVEIDGFSVSDLNSNWLTDNITLVEQLCTLFNDTLRNNILLGKAANGVESVTEEDVQDACQMALLKEVIRDLDQGLDTIVGTNGVTLSGGQQQRVALARAKLRDTPILILDESVSALDIVLRELIIEAVKKWRAGKTTIILTHELSQIGKDDFVYLMENGEVSQFGLRRDLENVGLFKKLASLQDTTVEKIHDDEFDEDFEGFTFAKQIGSRLSAQILSTVNLLSFFQAQQRNNFNFEIDHDVIDRKVGRRVKRSRTVNITDDIETAIEEVDKRPALIPITTIVSKMSSTVQKKFILILAILMSILSGAVNPIFSYCFAKLLSGIVPQSDSDVGSPKYLLKWSLIVLFLALFDGTSTFLKEFLLAYSSEVWVFDLRKRVFKIISQQGMTWFGEKSNTPSEINSLVLNDARDLRSLISHFLGVVSTVTVLALLGLIWALVKGWKLSLVCISLIPLFIITSGLYAGLLQSSENEYKNAVADLETQLYETVNGIKTIKVLRLDNYFNKKFDQRVHDLQKIATRRALFTGMGVALTNMLTFIVQGVLLYYGMKLVGKGEYSVDQLMITFVLLVFSIMSSVQLMSQIPDISRGQRAGSYIFRLLELEPSLTETVGDVIPTLESTKTVRFNNIKFNYPSSPEHLILNNLNLEIHKGEIAAVIGESGSGKSTLTLLITRLFETASDSVFFQDVDVNKLNLNYLRSSIALVDQKATFFDGSILENITYGLKEYSEDDVIEVLKLANIYDFAISLPNALNTRIDTSLISGGQAQRLSIARALIRKPKLLILDECTSALDAESTFKISELIQKNLKGLGITVMMITHSEDMMKISDRIITLKNGTVVEEGNYQRLFAKRGEFYRIVTAGLT